MANNLIARYTQMVAPRGRASSRPLRQRMAASLKAHRARQRSKPIGKGLNTRAVAIRQIYDKVSRARIGRDMDRFIAREKMNKVLRTKRITTTPYNAKSFVASTATGPKRVKAAVKSKSILSKPYAGRVRSARKATALKARSFTARAPSKTRNYTNSYSTLGL